MRSQRFSVLAVAIAGAPCGRPRQRRRDGAGPQGCSDTDTPLVLKAQGSFFVGGEKVEQTQGELGDLGPGGHITVNQMYVRYMVPQGGDGNVPVVMLHGATLTGKSWETTPDGRMGWDEYFVRKGHPVYVPDQVGRGRSGFNQAVFNNVRAGSAPPANLPALASIQRRRRLAQLPLRLETRRAFPTVSSRWPPWTNCRSRACRTSALAAPHSQPDDQGVVRSRRPVEWRRVDGALAVRIVSFGGGAAQSRRGERSRARRAGQLPGQLHRRTDRRRWRRCRSWSCSVIIATRRPAFRRCPHGRPVSRLSGADRPPQGRRRSGADAQPAGPRHPRQQPHDHAGQNNLQIADLILQWIDERVSKRTGANK